MQMLPEIIEHIVDMLVRGEARRMGDRQGPSDLSSEVLETLKSCLQVNHAFRRPARAIIFKTVRIKANEDTPGYFGRRLDTLADVLRMSNSDILSQPLAKVIETFEFDGSAASGSVLGHASMCAVFTSLAFANSHINGRLTKLQVHLPDPTSQPQSGCHRCIFTLLKTARSVRVLLLAGLQGMPTGIFYGAKFDRAKILACSFAFEDGTVNSSSEGTVMGTTPSNPPAIKQLSWNNFSALSFADEVALFGLHAARTQKYQALGPDLEVKSLFIFAFANYVPLDPAGNFNVGVTTIPPSLLRLARPVKLEVVITHIASGNAEICRFINLTRDEAVLFHRAPYLQIDAVRYCNGLANPEFGLTAAACYLSAIGGGIDDIGQFHLTAMSSNIRVLRIDLPTSIFGSTRREMFRADCVPALRSLILILERMPLLCSIPEIHLAFLGEPIDGLSAVVSFLFSNIMRRTRVRVSFTESIVGVVV